MAKINGLDKLTYAELADLRNRVDVLMAQKRNSERVELRDKITDMLKDHGLTAQDIFGKARKGVVAVKYRDPKNPENTWTGRGRMPRWMAAATKGNKAKKEDFLV
jgi:DNA-binding protein H-NS